MHFYQAFDLLTERGYRVRHNGTEGFALWAVSKPTKQGGYHRPVEMTDSAFLALAAGQWAI